MNEFGQGQGNEWWRGGSFEREEPSPEDFNLGPEWLRCERDLLSNMLLDPLGECLAIVGKLGLNLGGIDGCGRGERDGCRIVGGPVVVDVKAEGGIHHGRMSRGRFG